MSIGLLEPWSPFRCRESLSVKPLHFTFRLSASEAYPSDAMSIGLLEPWSPIGRCESSLGRAFQFRSPHYRPIGPTHQPFLSDGLFPSDTSIGLPKPWSPIRCHESPPDLLF
ncbi:hypothetical protein DPX16_22767 [Anabarilius grahami]|uniref:Uncharacterized protein n=1 Tax=Anabarilius grahami TaxID=495550 RepID=A0A3N0YQF6_ANAGA|nr:hypothetical protein DPX16_22767 [Anabarilius grahami]